MSSSMMTRILLYYINLCPNSLSLIYFVDESICRYIDFEIHRFADPIVSLQIPQTTFINGVFSDLKFKINTNFAF